MHLYELILHSDDKKVYILCIYLSIYDKERVCVCVCEYVEFPTKNHAISHKKQFDSN